jgi:hypothetical protein
MPSGRKTLVFNTLERALSTDMNRLQAFDQAASAEAARWMMDVQLHSDDAGVLSAAPYMDIQTTTLTTPLTGEIVGGLLVRPALGTSGTPLGLLVDPGVGWVVAPDTDTDASVYKYVNDPGVQTTGTLSMTANSSGSLRIDVIECQYTLNANAETDNRDIFNPATGAFAATTVSKATQAGFTYRVRQGTPGAGFPGTASGWMPLCVASVPTGTTTNDTIVFYDVRPMTSDRANAPYNVPQLSPRLTRNQLCIDNAGGATAPLSGLVETTGYADPSIPQSYAARLGGDLTATDLSQAQYQDGSVANGLAYVWLLAPFGLPRWARYTPSTFGARIPLSKGVIVLSNTGPKAPLIGYPSAAITLPASLFGTATTSAGYCVGATVVAGGAVANTVADGDMSFVSNGTTGYSQAAGVVTGTSPGTATFTFTPNGTTSNLGYAASAKRLRVSIQLVLAVNSATSGILGNLVAFAEPSGGGDTFYEISLNGGVLFNASGGSVNMIYNINLDIPVSPSVLAAWKFVVQATLTSCTWVSAVATINGVSLN